MVAGKQRREANRKDIAHPSREISMMGKNVAGHFERIRQYKYGRFTHAPFRWNGFNHWRSAAPGFI